MANATAPKTVANMVEDYKRGFSTEELAEKYKLGNSTAFRLMKKAGIVRTRSAGHLFLTDGWRNAHIYPKTRAAFATLPLTKEMMQVWGFNRTDPIQWKVVITKHGLRIIFKQGTKLVK